MKDDFTKKGWFELTANFCPMIGEKVQRLGRSVFTRENMEIVEDILRNVKEHEKDPNKLETIEYIWCGIRRLTGVFPNGYKK